MASDNRAAVANGYIHDQDILISMKDKQPRLLNLLSESLLKRIDLDDTPASANGTEP